jgi:hypothetical protein
MEPSADASSVTGSSTSEWVCARTERTDAPSVAAELCTGITTETTGTAVLLTQIGLVMDVVVAGQGYVGWPLAVRAAEVGHRVVGYDGDLHLSSGSPPVSRTWRT